MERRELPNEEKIRTPLEKVTYKNLIIFAADSIKQVEVKEKIKKRISDERENYSKPNSMTEISSKG